MEKTLEIRWFFKGIPPAIVQHWFRFECVGEFAGELEVRKDWYALRGRNCLKQPSKLLPSTLNHEQINLKLRQGSLELKLRQQEFGTYEIGDGQVSHCDRGNVEQWCKYTQQELKDFIVDDYLDKTIWIEVHKERRQKIERDVKIEFGCVQINNDSWWTIAFEMTQNDCNSQLDRRFTTVLQKACQTYSGSNLLASNSYGYSRWLLMLEN